MPYDPNRHHRRSIRLKGYDYTQPGAYFITICTQNRECLFGEVVDGGMRLNEYGEIAREEWFKTADLRSYVELHRDEFVVMPNHVHGIIWITDHGGAPATDNGAPATDNGAPATDNGAPATDNGAPATDNGAPATNVSVGAQRRCAPTDTTPTIPTDAKPTISTISTINVTPGSIGAIVRAFKSATTKRINEMRGSPGAPVWQRNYYEHIIRHERALERIREYIVTNPQRWALDCENPQHTGTDTFDIWLEHDFDIAEEKLS